MGPRGGTLSEGVSDRVVCGKGCRKPHRSANVSPKLPPAVKETPTIDQDVGQEAGHVAENSGQVGFGANMLRNMDGDGRRPRANREIRNTRIDWCVAAINSVQPQASRSYPK